MAFAQYATYQSVYNQLKLAKGTAIIAANCIDAAVTGSNSTAVGATCDFITSFFLVGDLRDLAIQSWHYHFGDRANYDALTAQLAGIGAIGSLASTGAIGVPLNVIAAAGKVVAKTLKKLGPVGLKVSNVIGSKIAKTIADKNLTVGQKADQLNLMIPVIEISASVAVVYKEQPKVFQLLAHMLSTPDKFDRMVTWFGGYLGRLEAELANAVASIERTSRSWRSFFFAQAHAAISAEVNEAFIKNLRSLIRAMGDDAADLAKLSDNFHEALELFLELRDRADFKDAFKSIADDMNILRPCTKIIDIADASALKKLLNMQAFSDLGIPSLKRHHYLQAIDVMDFKNLLAANLSDGALKTLKKEMATLIGTMGHASFKDAKGAQHHFLSLVEESLKPNGKKLQGLEVEVDTKLGRRFMDSSWEGDLYTENKAIADALGHARSTVATSKTQKGVVDPDFRGQMLRDISNFDPDSGFKTQWLYTPEGLSDLSEAALKAKSDAIAEKMVNLIKADKKAIQVLQNARGLEDKQAVSIFLDKEVLPALKANIEVANYANVRAALKIIDEG